MVNGFQLPSKKKHQFLNELQKNGEVQDWYFSEQLRRYILAVQEKADQTYQDQSYPDTFNAWLKWASEVADKRDPLKQDLPAYTKTMEMEL
jgi:hypothetical protein